MSISNLSMNFFSRSTVESGDSNMENSGTRRFQAEKRVISDKVSSNLENIFRLNK